ncbi:MAG: ureidoglycolate lyase [Hyphomicrobiales bacterium]|nr:ureidoglycolate lyase [Hyphomicrobiales bacterium]
MSNVLHLEPLTRAGFAPFGDVIEKAGAHQHPINDGTCTRYHDLAQVELLGGSPRALINIFAPQPCVLPYAVKLVERHPCGSQAFVPLSRDPFVAVVCEDEDGAPVRPRAFLTDGRQGVNYRVNVWHAPLIALADGAEFLVVDRGGDGDNLEEFTLPEMLVIRGRN